MAMSRSFGTGIYRATDQTTPGLLASRANMQNYSSISFLKIPSKSNRLQNISGLHHVLSAFHVYSCFMIGLVCLLDITRPSPNGDAAAFPWTPGVCFFKCPTQPVATVACTSEKMPLTAAG